MGAVAERAFNGGVHLGADLGATVVATGYFEFERHFARAEPTPGIEQLNLDAGRTRDDHVADAAN